jgi:hypothetical protein
MASRPPTPFASRRRRCTRGARRCATPARAYCSTR